MALSDWGNTALTQAARPQDSHWPNEKPKLVAEGETMMQVEACGMGHILSLAGKKVSPSIPSFNASDRVLTTCEGPRDEANAVCPQGTHRLKDTETQARPCARMQMGA